MATFNFIRIAETTDKALKVVVRESGYDLSKMKDMTEKYFWIPKSVSTIEGNTITVADWFYNKNIAPDHYGSMMESFSNY